MDQKQTRAAQNLSTSVKFHAWHWFDITKVWGLLFNIFPLFYVISCFWNAFNWRPGSCQDPHRVWHCLTQWMDPVELPLHLCRDWGRVCSLLNICVYVYFSNSSCLQIVLHPPAVTPSLVRAALTEGCWKRLGWLGMNQNCRKKTAKTVWCARMALWTGCSCPADTRACVMAASGISSSAPCAGSSCRSLFHFAAKRSKMRMNRPVSCKMFFLEEFFNRS